MSVQERKIFELLQHGKSNKEISEDLYIGISSVKSHLNSICSKLKIKSRKETLILYLYDFCNTLRTVIQKFTFYFLHLDY